MAQRQYENATVFNARIVDMRHLFVPSTEYKGKPTQKPNYFASFIVPKTQQLWFNEPVLAGLAGAVAKFSTIMQMYSAQPNMVKWPVVDGDMPNPETGEVSDSARGHWRFSGSSSNPPNVEIVQAGGVLTKLPQRVGVKSGDYVMTGVTAAISTQDARAVKLYLNAVVFSAPGEEIVFANSVSGAELMKMAQAQGLNVAGFSPSPGGFGGAPQGGGFPPAQQGGFPQGGGAGFPQPGGAPVQNPPTTFAQPQTFTPGGFAQPQGGGATAFPSSQPQQQGGFPNPAPFPGR